MVISDVEFHAASPSDRRAGMLGWIGFTLDDAIRVDGVALRRTLDDRLVLGFPARRDRSGRQHAYVRPVDDRSRCEVERQVFAALGLTEEGP